MALCEDRQKERKKERYQCLKHLTGCIFLNLLVLLEFAVDFKARNKCLTVKPLKQGYRYHRL